MKTIPNFPHEIKDLDAEQVNKIMKNYEGEDHQKIRVGPKGYLLPQCYVVQAAAIYNMEVRPTDVYVCSFPRSGTTWTQELVWMVANDLDYATSNAVTLNNRYPFLESSVLSGQSKNTPMKDNKDCDDKLDVEWLLQPATEQLEQMKERRFVKTHLPLSLLPPNLLQAKVVYVARDPRDVAVSFYYMNKMFRGGRYLGDMRTFWQLFVEDLVLWTPYFENLKEAWEKRHHPNMLFLFYEDLAKDLPAAVRRVSDFFGKQYTEEQITRLCDHLSIDSFKTNKSVNCDNIDSPNKFGLISSQSSSGLIRKGGVGGWREYFDDEMSSQAQQWIAHNLRDTDLRFPHFNL